MCLNNSGGTFMFLMGFDDKGGSRRGMFECDE